MPADDPKPPPQPATGAPASIDVLLPAYNAERTLAQSIRSIQRQTLRDFRIVAVNDGSTDRTSTILHAMAAQDPRIHVIDQPNGGIVDAMNAGLKRCTAAFVARHDADDISFPDRFEKQLAHLRAHPETLAVSANVHVIDDDGRRTGEETGFKDVENADARCIPVREPFLMHPFLMVRREAIERVGGYRHVFHAEDADLYWRLLPFGRLDNLGLLGEYRVHSNSITGRSVLNGRVNAVHTQLAAISHLRRLAGREDIQFAKGTLDRYHRAGSLEGMVALGAEQLDPAEARFLRLGAVANLFAMALYRPYSLEAQDCAFGRQVMARDLAIVDAGSAHVLRRQHLYLGALLVRRRRIGLALAACPPLMFPKIAAHFLRSRVARLLDSGLLPVSAWRNRQPKGTR